MRWLAIIFRYLLEKNCEVVKCMSIYATNIKRLYLPKGYWRERVNTKSLRIILLM
jgi:hypothetical protein